MKEKKMSIKKRLLIELLIALASIITIAVLLFVCGMLIPHNKHFTSVREVRTIPDEEETYKHYYYAVGLKRRCFIYSNEDLNDFIKNGECDIKIKIKGIRWYREDRSGIFIKSPVIAYEFVKTEEEKFY